MLTHFIFHDTAPTEIYTLSLHDALPICCAEQRASRSLALMLAADLGEAFNLPGIDPAKEKPAVQASLLELTNFQCGDRKSTRLNSSHSQISYAVFCLKKKNKLKINHYIS